MEASQTPGNEPEAPTPEAPTEPDEQREGAHKFADPQRSGVADVAPQSGAPEAPAAERGLGGPSSVPGVAEGSEPAPVQAVEGATDEVPSEEERNPARDQAPVATDAQEAIVGDPGLREQQPFGNEGSPTAVDRAVATSAPPPSAQSGVPLSEDRQAGIEPGPKGPAVPVREDAEGEVPEHDASEGQTTTPPMGG